MKYEVGKFYFAITHRRETKPEDAINGPFYTYSEAKKAMYNQDIDDSDYYIYIYTAIKKMIPVGY